MPPCELPYCWPLCCEPLIEALVLLLSLALLLLEDGVEEDVLADLVSEVLLVVFVPDLAFVAEVLDSEAGVLLLLFEDVVEPNEDEALVPIVP